MVPLKCSHKRGLCLDLGCLAPVNRPMGVSQGYCCIWDVGNGAQVVRIQMIFCCCCPVVSFSNQKEKSAEAPPPPQLVTYKTACFAKAWQMIRTFSPSSILANHPLSFKPAPWAPLRQQEVMWSSTFVQFHSAFCVFFKKTYSVFYSFVWFLL